MLQNLVPSLYFWHSLVCTPSVTHLIITNILELVPITLVMETWAIYGPITTLFYTINMAVACAINKQSSKDTCMITLIKH